MTIGLAKQEIDGARCAGVGEVAEPPDRQLSIGFAGQIGQRDEKMRFALKSPQIGHQPGFGDPLGRVEASDFTQDIGQAIFDRFVE